MLDLFCGRWGWSKAFAAKGWECCGVDLVSPPEIPANCWFFPWDVLSMNLKDVNKFDFICASPPCEQFSVHGMKHFHPNPPYPELGIKLFEHTRRICEESGVPYVIENVRAAQQFIGNAVHHCGPFYLWGTGVPLLVNQGIKKGWGSTWIDKQGHLRSQGPSGRAGRIGVTGMAGSKLRTAEVATIPLELANCVADYAERLLEQKTSAGCLSRA